MKYDPLLIMIQGEITQTLGKADLELDRQFRWLKAMHLKAENDMREINQMEES